MFAKLHEQSKKAPLLTHDEEKALIHKYQNAKRRKDKEDALDNLVRPFMRYVLKHAKSYQNYGIHIDDLASEGFVGLVTAIQKFEPERNLRLATYASHWIRAFITDYIIRNWSLVRVGTTSAQKKLFFNLRKLKAKLEVYGDLIPDAKAKEIAKTLSVRPDEVHSVNQRLSRDGSLNAPAGKIGGDQSDVEIIDILPDNGITNAEDSLVETDEHESRMEQVRDAMETLSTRERTIFSERYLQQRKLADIAKTHKISRERVRQISGKALEKVTKVVKEKQHDYSTN